MINLFFVFFLYVIFKDILNYWFVFVSEILDYRVFFLKFLAFIKAPFSYNKLDSFFWILDFHGLNYTYWLSSNYYLDFLNYFSFFNKHFLIYRLFCKKRISRIKYGNRRVFGLFFGNPKLNFFYRRRNPLSYNIFFLRNLKVFFNRRFFIASGHKNYLRRFVVR